MYCFLDNQSINQSVVSGIDNPLVYHSKILIGVCRLIGDGHSLTKEIVEGAFSAHGKVSDSYVPDGKAFAFVTYETKEEAQAGGDALNCT